MFVFPANDEGYRKRKRAHKACEQCKRRRKRCEPPLKNQERCLPCMKEDIACSLTPPVQGAPSQPPSGTSVEPDDVSLSAPVPPLRKRTTKQPARHVSTSSVSSTSSSPPTNASAAAAAAAAVAKFAVSTAATLLDHATPAAHETSSEELATVLAEPPVEMTTDAAIAAVIAPAPLPAPDAAAPFRSAHKDANGGVWVKCAPRSLNKFLLAYLESLRAFEHPSRFDRKGLMNVYFKYIQPLLPLFDEDTFREAEARDECPTLLLHAVLLVACRHPSAKAFLNSSPRHFASMTATKLRALIFADIEKDKMTLIRVLALLSLHSEGADGLDKSCADLELAFHYAHFLGIHHERHNAPEQAPIRRLWWCLWCLDRMSACVCARPVISRLDDVGARKPDIEEEGWLGRLVEVCSRLDSVIAMYRPMGSTLPSAVDVEITYGSEENTPFAKLLHMLQHVACILAHKRAPESPEVNAAVLLHATAQILKIVRTTPNLHPLPAVPYAVSLTLTVYLRLFPSPEAKLGWQESCQVLSELAKTWWVAEAMVKIARSVFKKLEEDFAVRIIQEAAVSQAVAAKATEMPTGTIAARRSAATRTKSSADKKKRDSRTAVANGPTRTVKEERLTAPNLPSAVVSSDTVVSEPASRLTEMPVSFSNLTTLPTGSLEAPPSSSTGFEFASLPALLPVSAIPYEYQILDMFSDLPNPTSFLDQMTNMDEFLLPSLTFDDSDGMGSYIGGEGAATLPRLDCTMS
ncbi:uncharacterized protein V1518DRAFT_50488 [Limtongia smithiae]|uniref:uncharacterized protein n=1 Tax=Limtongia smithiae TaxID=1125753 RepID=UPI0034CE13BF